MASKLCLVFLAATSLALLLVTEASILRTTVAEIEEENPSKGSCSQQLRWMSLTPCMNWIKYSSSSSGGGGSSGAELEEAEDDHQWEMTRQGISSSQQCKKQCCNMMKQFEEDEECMCSALKKTVREKCMSGHGREMCGERMTEKLMSVPMICGLMNEKCQYRMIVI